MIFEDSEKCCACGACIEKCPKSAIHFENDCYENTFAVIDKDKCISCNVCETACPEFDDGEKLFPIHVYAAWNSNKEQQYKSSSGGVAAAIMKYCMESAEYDCFATVWTREQGNYTKKIETEEDFLLAVGSKYIEGNLYPALPEIKNSFGNGKKVAFIGLPCQCNAVKKFFKKDSQNLILVELICHGGVPNSYFEQHLANIEHKKGKTTKNLAFRTHPLDGFCLSLYSDKQYPFYKAKMHSGKDLYYLAFRENIIFREKCYHCSFANEKRASDITLGDYSGLGTLWEYNGTERKVNLLLCMTQKASDFLNLLENRITYIERPLAEPYCAKGNPQLRAPNKITEKHIQFLNAYKKYQDFDKAIRKVLSAYSAKVQFLNFLYFLFRMIRFIPRRIWWKVHGKK